METDHISLVQLLLELEDKSKDSDIGAVRLSMSQSDINWIIRNVKSFLKKNSMDPGAVSIRLIGGTWNSPEMHVSLKFLRKLIQVLEKNSKMFLD